MFHFSFKVKLMLWIGIIAVAFFFSYITFRGDFSAAEKTNNLFYLTVFLSAANLILIKLNYSKQRLIFYLKGSLDALDFPVTTTDMKMKWVFINKVTESLLAHHNLDKKSAIGKHCSNWQSDICETENCGVRCLRNGYETTHYTQKYPDQPSTYMQVDTHYITDDKDKKIGHVEYVKKIENTKQLAEAANIQGIIFCCKMDENWTMLYMSSHVEELTGYSTKEFINNAEYSFNSMIYEKDRERVAKSVYNAVAQKEPWEIEYRICHKNGNMYWVLEKGSAVYDKKGDVESLDGFIININEKKTMEEHLSQTQKMEALGALAGGVAHDFNNILSGIIGFTELLQEDLKHLDNSDRLKQRADYIMKGSLRAGELVSQILAFTRSDNYQLRSFDPVIIAKEVIRLIEPTLPSNIKVKKYLNSDLKIFGEPSKIHQVLMNLCTNAAYAMKEKGGVLSLEMYKTEKLPLKYLEEKSLKAKSYLCISVKDTGCGMSEDIIEKITEPFFTTKPVGEGTGMGLWVIKGIIYTMNGFIDIQSKENSGSEFKLFIPADETESHKTENRKEKKSLKGRGNICFVDDEESLTNLVYHSLSGYGYNVQVFNSSYQALKDFEKRSSHYDIIITDFSMPQLSGHDLVMKVKKIRPDIPVILYTGVFNENIKNLDLSNFDEVLSKPILMSDLASSVKKLIKNKEN